ncbi:aspartate-semialdehyde dehydrogenase [candidate division KD3-62 bacterium DG_56]|uniref:Aspartate-semialdehyde dehydrogenase n=1 Tax=candidate division KD3-62 bacterium DG_56 TaxID=1704032 RepID=A0A0S7XQ59_9BACT|nr:MAG: aspartate-semialdehyde dehydrogenase [candidate division KD3-62 bacterium DG_56]
MARAKNYNVAVVGIGAVGRDMVRVLHRRKFPMTSLRVFARSTREEQVDGRRIKVEKISERAFRGVDIALFAGSEEPQGHLGWPAVKQGAVVIDNGSAYRLYPNVPLVVPEVNPQDLSWHEGLVANPNCSTIQFVVALKPLYDIARIRRAVVATYQSTSGKSAAAMDQLRLEWDHLVSGKEPPTDSVFPHPIGDNIIPHIDRFDDKGTTREESKLLHETRKIMGDPDLLVTVTAVRVPVLRGHSEAVNLEFDSPITAKQARAALRRAPGVVVQDDPDKEVYPMPHYAAGKDPVYVGRIREDHTVPHGLNLWVVSDNLLKGAALNAVQIAETMIEGKLI